MQKLMLNLGKLGNGLGLRSQIGIWARMWSKTLTSIHPHPIRHPYHSPDPNHRPQSGIALMLVIFITAILLLLGTTLVKLIYSSYTHTAYRLAKLKAFYLAEAAIEYGKIEIVNNPSWYTDVIVTDPEKGIGRTIELGTGKSKSVREQGKNILYAIGNKGKTKSIIKVMFQPVPFKQISWEGY